MTKYDILLDRNWFYEFDLPNGNKTCTDSPPNVRLLQIYRKSVLLNVIEMHFGDEAGISTSIDIGSHEGYYALELARRFQSVCGVEKNIDSLNASRAIFDAHGVSNAKLICDDFLNMNEQQLSAFDFVLLYGVIYHLEDPIRMLRKAALITKRVMLIETQILNFDIDAKIDWGNYDSQKQVQGVFGVISDDPESREGGTTEIALVPSIGALYTVLYTLGFSSVTKIEDVNRTCEQYYRDRRVILLCIR